MGVGVVRYLDDGSITMGSPALLLFALAKLFYDKAVQHRTLPHKFAENIVGRATSLRKNFKS